MASETKPQIPDIPALRRQFFPFTTRGGYTIRSVSEAEWSEGFKQHFHKIFPDSERVQRLLFNPSAERAQVYAPMEALHRRSHHEWLVIEDAQGQAIGWHHGFNVDALTYLMGITGILPEQQGKGVYSQFAERLFEYVGAIGYERISSHHQTTNRAILIAKLKLGFDIVAIELSEIWGPFVKLVKLLPRDRRESYVKIYGMLDHL